MQCALPITLHDFLPIEAPRRKCIAYTLSPCRVGAESDNVQELKMVVLQIPEENETR